jgi:hypothetical protein
MNPERFIVEGLNAAGVGASDQNALQARESYYATVQCDRVDDYSFGTVNMESSRI